jgi:hypothetical protein
MLSRGCRAAAQLRLLHAHRWAACGGAAHEPLHRRGAASTSAAASACAAAPEDAVLVRAQPRSLPRGAACALSAHAVSSRRNRASVRLPLSQLRDFLFDRLYHPREGYFTRSHGAVGTLPAPLPFAHLLNRGEYVAHVEAAYRAAGVSWFTPVELFRPWYARALARHILAAHDAAAGPLRVYELGGGGGTCARGVLDAVAELTPDVYATMSYIAVDVRAACGRCCALRAAQPLCCDALAALPDAARSACVRRSAPSWVAARRRRWRTARRTRRGSAWSAATQRTPPAGASPTQRRALCWL